MLTILFAFEMRVSIGSRDAVCGKTCFLSDAALFFADVEGGPVRKGQRGRALCGRCGAEGCSSADFVRVASRYVFSRLTVRCKV